MTLIECYDESVAQNIAACLYLRPEKLLLLGEAEAMKAQASRYRKLLKRRGLQTELVLRGVRGNDMADIAAVLARTVREEQECVIDLTGGDEVVILAVGAVLAGLDAQQRSRVSVQKFDLETGAAIDCDSDGRVVPGSPAALTVHEVIALHGGVIHPGSYQPPMDCTTAHIEPLWTIVSEDPKKWNRTIALLNEFESRSDGTMQIDLPIRYLRGNISNFDEKEGAVRELLDKLHRYGVIDDRSSRDTLAYTYTAPVLRYCTQKAGNVLEVKTLLEGRAVSEKGMPYFQDCRMSVSIDWDGIIHNSAKRVPETRNEIDVVLMHGMTPLFISCKNGNIGEEELYKLHTVASRFAGPRVRKMLIATDMDMKSAGSNRAFVQRAWDMDIFLVTDAAELSKEEWRQIFIKAMG